MKSAKLPQTIKTLSDGGWFNLWLYRCGDGVSYRKCYVLWCMKWCFALCPAVEDQKELASPVSPELRQKEVQMNFLNQLTSVFNPRVSASPSIMQETQVYSPRIGAAWCLTWISVHSGTSLSSVADALHRVIAMPYIFLCFHDIFSICLILGGRRKRGSSFCRSNLCSKDKKHIHCSECSQPARTGWGSAL